MNPKLAQDLLQASIDERMSAACRRRLAAAAAPPAALRQRWGAGLVALGARVSRDPELFVLYHRISGREVDRGAHPDRSGLRAVRSTGGTVGR